MKDPYRPVQTKSGCMTSLAESMYTSKIGTSLLCMLEWSHGRATILLLDIKKWTDTEGGRRGLRQTAFCP